MKYKGYVSKVEFDEDAQVFYGWVVNTRSVIDFYGSSVGELKKEFEFSVDEYLSYCKEHNIEPEKPYSGKFNVRLSPELHEKVATRAAIEGVSLNSYVTKALEDELMEG